MDRQPLQQRLDDMFPDGVRVVVGATSPSPIAFWTARVAVLDAQTVYIIPLFWEHGGEFTFVGEPEFAEDAAEVTFSKAYPRGEDLLDIRLDLRFKPVGMEDRIKQERSTHDEEWLDVLRQDYDNAKASDG